MRQVNIAVATRDESGKGAARRLRRAGKIPAVFYGNKSESLSLAVDSRSLKDIIQSETGRSTFLNLKFEGEKESEKLAIIKELQVNPVTDMLIHADFYELRLDEKITAPVPVRLVGTAKGVEMGGTLQPIRRELDVKCLPKDMPEYIEVDISDLGLDESIHIDDVTLAAGVEVPHDVNFTVVVLLGQRGKKEEEEEAGEEGAEGAEATPAEGE